MEIVGEDTAGADLTSGEEIADGNADEDAAAYCTGAVVFFYNPD